MSKKPHLTLMQLPEKVVNGSANNIVTKLQEYEVIELKNTVAFQIGDVLSQSEVRGFSHYDYTVKPYKPAK